MLFKSSRQIGWNMGAADLITIWVVSWGLAFNFAAKMLVVLAGKDPACLLENPT